MIKNPRTLRAVRKWPTCLLHQGGVRSRGSEKALLPMVQGGKKNRRGRRKAGPRNRRMRGSQPRSEPEPAPPTPSWHYPGPRYRITRSRKRLLKSVEKVRQLRTRIELKLHKLCLNHFSYPGKEKGIRNLERLLLSISFFFEDDQYVEPLNAYPPPPETSKKVNPWLNRVDTRIKRHAACKTCGMNIEGTGVYSRVGLCRACMAVRSEEMVGRSASATVLTDPRAPLLRMHVTKSVALQNPEAYSSRRPGKPSQPRSASSGVIEDGSSPLLTQGSKGKRR